MNYNINHLFLFIISIIIIGCSSAPEEENIRFKPLKEPIEGTLLFVAGPDLEELDSLQNNYPWDFYQLNGKQFTKLNDESFFPEGDDGRWNFQWSPGGNYLSYYHDKGPFGENTDDIGVIDINSFIDIYVTDSLGDANTFDGALYQWAVDDSYIYFTAISLGQTEYDDNISPDIYRAKPSGSKLEQITNNNYYEAHAIPTFDGQNIFYQIYKEDTTPDSIWGYYVYDLDSKTSEQVVSSNQWKAFTGFPINYPNGFLEVIVNRHPDGNNIIIDNEFLVNVETRELKKINIEGTNILYGLLFIPNNNNYAILYRSWLEGGIYKLKLNDGTIRSLTTNLTTIDGERNIFRRPAISPSGKFIAFTAQLDYNYSDWNGFGENLVRQKTEIYLMNLETEEVTKLTEGLFGWEGYLKWIE